MLHRDTVWCGSHCLSRKSKVQTHSIKSGTMYFIQESLEYVNSYMPSCNSAYQKTIIRFSTYKNYTLWPRFRRIPGTVLRTLTTLVHCAVVSSLDTESIIRCNSLRLVPKYIHRSSEGLFHSQICRFTLRPKMI